MIWGYICANHGERCRVLRMFTYGGFDPVEFVRDAGLDMRHMGDTYQMTGMRHAAVIWTGEGETL